MRLQLVVVLASAAIAAMFALLNPSVLLEARVVQFLGLRTALPVVEVLLLAAGTALVLLLLLNGATLYERSRVQRRLEVRLAQREQEIMQLKSGAYDRVPEAIDGFRRELLVKMEAQGRMLREDLAGQIARLRRLPEAPSGPDGAEGIHRPQEESDREAAA